MMKFLFGENNESSSFREKFWIYFNKDKKELKKSNKDDKNEIKVEGKSKKPAEKKQKTQKEDEEDMNIDLEEIDRIVFQQTKKTKDNHK